MKRFLRALLVAVVLAGSLFFPSKLVLASEMVTQVRPVPQLDRSDTQFAPQPPGLLVLGGEVTDDPFRMIGFSWTDPHIASVQVRVQQDGVWAPWNELSIDVDHDEDEHDHADHAAPGQAEVQQTMPSWVDQATGYEVALLPSDAIDLTRVTAASMGLQVALVRTGGDQIKLASDLDQATANVDIRSRSSWGARAPSADPTIEPDLSFAVVHHTALLSADAYGPDDVPDLLRAMQAYHMDARGFDDIGYNFIVDRFGRAWEARAGGTTKAVVGAHASGYNFGSVGVAVLGNFDLEQPTDNAVATVRALIDWKFNTHGVNRATKAVVEHPTTGQPVELDRIVSHGELGPTACPGHNLQAQMPTIRTVGTTAGGTVGGGSGGSSGSGEDQQLINAASMSLDDFATRTIKTRAGTTWASGDFNGDGIDDVVWGNGSQVTSLWSGTTAGRFKVSTPPPQPWRRPLVGDFDGDGKDDILWYGAGQLSDSMWFGGAGGFATQYVNVRGTYDPPFVGDFDGNGKDDVFWYTPSGSDFTWHFSGRGRWTAARTAEVIDASIGAVGDFDGDGIEDLYWHGPGDAPNSTWFGRGDGGFDRTEAVNVRSNVNPLEADVNGDGVSDIVWSSPLSWDGLWYGNTDRRLRSSEGFTRRSSADLLTLDIDADGRDDLLRVDRSGGWEIVLGANPAGFAIDGEGLRGYQPLTGDFDGDRMDDLLWIAPGSGGSSIWLSR